MALLIDTDVFIMLERRGRNLEALAASAGLASDEQVAVAAITASELLVGVQRAVTDDQRARREAFVEAILDRMPVLPFDLKSARVHARLVTQLEKSGFRIGAHDLLIAATALTHGRAILTVNVREFERVPGLEIRSLA